MRSVVIGVGSNLGSREASIRAAHVLLDADPRVHVVAASPIYETAPVGPPQPDYLNAALRIETDLDPRSILELALDVEKRLGRDRAAAERWGARSLDLDLLWDERGPFIDDQLNVPHRELEQRAFALTPLLDVAPELNTRYGDALQKTGALLSPWKRAATRTSHAGIETVVESDDILDACTLAVSGDAAVPEPLLTERRTIDSSASALADAINTLAQIGFVTHLATVSHCSNTQWVAHFHSVNEAIPRAQRVRLETTSGVERAYSARASLETPNR